MTLDLPNLNSLDMIDMSIISMFSALFIIILGLAS